MRSEWGGKRVREFLWEESGASTVLGLLWFILFVGVAGLAVDATNGFRVQTGMQATADAAAHAAVMDLPDETAVTNTALAYTEENMPAETYGSLLAQEDVVIGVWEPNLRVFAPGVTPPNAVMVTLRATEATANGIPVSFLRIIGLRQWDVTVAAIAAYSRRDDCLSNGFVARGWIETGSTSDYRGVCIHGQEYVKFGSGNSFADDVEVTMLDENDLEAGSDNEGLAEAVGSRDYLPPLVDQVGDIITGLADGSVTPPSFLTETEHVSRLPDTLTEGTLYIVEGSDDVTLPYTVSNVGVVVLDNEAKLNIESDASVSNSLLAARGNVELGSNVQVGDDGFCDTTEGEVFVYTENWYKGGSNVDYTGVQIVATGTVDIGSDLTSGGVGPRALSVQAGQNIKWGSDEVFSKGCSAPSLFTLDGRVALVN